LCVVPEKNPFSHVLKNHIDDRHLDLEVIFHDHIFVAHLKNQDHGEPSQIMNHRDHDYHPLLLVVKVDVDDHSWLHFLAELFSLHYYYPLKNEEVNPTR
jgi:hypothetical protein